MRLTEAWTTHQSVMVQMPTGTGKTHLMVSLVKDFVASHEDVQVLILGTGEAHFENFFRDMNHEFPEKVAAKITFNLGLAARIYAGGDIYLMPSKSEPCGLSQMNAMRYGTVPVVHATGGLRDTVPGVDENGEMIRNPETMREITCYAEPSIVNAEAGERFQFFRKGYYIADEKLTTDTEKVFNKIVGLKSSWKK